MTRTAIVASVGDGFGLDLALYESGFAVLRTGSVREAGATLAEHPDALAVFTDVALPDGNWRDLVELVKVRGSAIRVVVCANDRTAELWWDALECGVFDVVAPPYSRHSFSQILEEVLR